MLLPFAKRSANQVKSNGIDATVDETEAEPKYSEVVPKIIIIVHRCGTEVEPQVVRVIWQKTDEKNNNKTHYHFANLSIAKSC